MTSNRPYNKRKTYKEAIDELKRCSNSQFDPVIVDEFIEVIKENRNFIDNYVLENKNNIERKRYEKTLISHLDDRINVSELLKQINKQSNKFISYDDLFIKTDFIFYSIYYYEYEDEEIYKNRIRVYKAKEIRKKLKDKHNKKHKNEKEINLLKNLAKKHNFNLIKKDT